MVNYIAAIKRPLQDIRKLLVGGAILLVTLIVLMIVSGILSVAGAFSPSVTLIEFLNQALATFIFSIPLVFFIMSGLKAAKNDYKIPEWKTDESFFKSGVSVGIINVAYMIPSFVLFSMAILGVFGESLIAELTALEYMGVEQLGSEQQGLVTEVIEKSLVLLPLMLVVLFVLSLIGTVAQFNYIKTGKLGSAFEFGQVFKIAFNSRFVIPKLIAWLVLLGISILSFACLFLVLDPGMLFAPLFIVALILIPLIISGFIYSGLLISYTISGQAYEETLQLLNPKPTITKSRNTGREIIPAEKANTEEKSEEKIARQKPSVSEKTSSKKKSKKKKRVIQRIGVKSANLMEVQRFINQLRFQREKS